MKFLLLSIGLAFAAMVAASHAQKAEASYTPRCRTVCSILNRYGSRPVCHLVCTR